MRFNWRKKMKHPIGSVVFDKHAEGRPFLFQVIGYIEEEKVYLTRCTDEELPYSPDVVVWSAKTFERDFVVAQIG